MTVVHIAHVANAYGPKSGGLRTAMHQLAAGYADAGHQVTMVVAGPSDSDDNTEFGRRVTVAAPVLPGSGGYRFITRPNRVTALLDELRPDALEVSDRTTLRGLGRWARDRGIPSLMWAHERVDGVLATWLPTSFPHGRVADLHNRRWARAFDAVACTTDFASEEFRRIGTKNIVSIPLGVDLDAFSPTKYDAALRQQLAPHGEPLLVLCSRLSKEKRPIVALDTIVELRRWGVAAQLVIAGDGPLSADLRRAAQGLPVTFLGFVQDRAAVARLLATADVVLAPGPIETFGLAALEALASGTNVVASQSSALSEVVGAHGLGAGIAVPSVGVSVAGAVLEILSRPLRARRARARERAEQFPWSRAVSRALDVHAALRQAHAQNSTNSSRVSTNNAPQVTA